MLPVSRSSVPSDDRQRVLDASDIARLIGDHIQLRPKGREYIGLCPFHDDHAPSMFVSPAKQIYKCFSCGAGGNAIDFVINYHKMSFREALEHLAERAGIALTPRRLFRDGADHGPPDAGAEVTTRAELLSANTTANTFFRAILNHPDHGELARRTLDRRGVTPEIADLFQIGASPDKWDGLSLTIANKGLEPAPFQAAGLLKARENSGGGGSGGFYDAFRNRLIFPIHDQIGRVIAFGGRRLNDEDEPKYLNSSESPVFDKSTTLYALHQAAQAIRTSRIAIVTEGYMDAIACHQAGVRNAVATLGTALTRGNARILRRLADTIVLLFDGDAAGLKAAERAVEVFFAEPVDVKIATLAPITDAKDPDELLKREGGVDTLRRVLAAAIDPLDLLFRRIAMQLEGQGLSARGRVVQEFVARLVDLGLERVDKVRYQLIVKRLAEIAGVEWDVIATAIADRRTTQRRRVPAGAETDAPLPEALGAREDLLGCIMNMPALTLSLQDGDWRLLDPATYTDPRTRAIASLLADLIATEAEPSLQHVLASLDDPEARRLATHIAATIARITGDDPEGLKAHWRNRLADARLDNARADNARAEHARAASPPGPGGGAAADIARNLGQLRELRTTFRRDARAVPRPPG